MTDDLKAPERIWAFDRYVNGVLMAEGVTITRASSFEEACVKATKLASRGPNNEAPVLVLAHRDAEHIAALEAELADMTQQRDRQYDENCSLIVKQAKTEAERDAAMAGAVKVKPLVFIPWSGGGCMGSPQPFQFFITQMQDQNGDFLCHWDSSTYKTLDEAKAHAQACYLPPDPDRLLALTAAAYEDAAAVIEDNVRHAKELGREIWAIPDLRTRIPSDALAALSRIEAQAEARGMRKTIAEIAPLLSSALASKEAAHTEGFANAMGERADGIELSIRRISALADATEAAAKGGV